MYSEPLISGFIKRLKDQALETAKLVAHAFTHEEVDAPTPIRDLRNLIDLYGLKGILPYEAYLPNEQLFTTPDGVGFIIECPPLTGANDRIADILLGLYQSASAKTGIQVLLYGGNNLLPTFKAYAAQRPNDDALGIASNEPRNTNIYRRMARRRIDHYLRGTRKPLFKASHYMLRDFRLMFSVLVPGKVDAVAIEEALTLRDAVHSTLQSASLPGRIWNHLDLIAFLQELFNPRTMFQPRPDDLPIHYDPDRYIRDQVTSPDEPSILESSGFTFKDPDDSENVDKQVCITGLSVVGYPQKHYLWQTDGFIGDALHASLQYPCPFLITMGSHVLDFDSAQNAVNLKGARAQSNASTQMGQLLPGFVKKAQDYKIAQHAMDEGYGMCDLYHQVLLFAPRKEIVRARHTTSSIWRSRRFRLVNDRYMQAQALLSALPLTLSPDFNSDLINVKRATRKTSANAVNMMPTLAEWKGTGTPVMLYFGRRGQVVALDFYDNTAGNFNFAIVGKPGSGKSFLLNEIILAYLAAGGKVWIIDVGRSYEKLCRMLGRQFILFEISSENPICINPFSWVVKIDEDMEMLKPLIRKMASPEQPLSSYEMGMIEGAIKGAWDEKGNKATITTVAEHLRKCVDETGSPDKRAYQLAVALRPYTAGGMYSVFFEGEATIDLRDDLVVLELEELKSKKDLQEVVMYIISYYITYEMYRNRFDGRRKVALIDEGWDLFGNDDDSAEFAEHLARRARKYKGALGTATQGVGDYFESAAGRALFKCSDWKIVMQQDQGDIDLFEKEMGKLDEPTKRDLTSIHTERGQYSEMYIRSPVGGGVVRLIADPFTQLLSSNHADDYNAINRYRDTGLSVDDAIEAVLRDRGLS
jgi:conjugal transfer ATP-binding protein TraC